MPISKRKRFEIFKRDGFRCRYCSATAAAGPLHVDHVIAVANGGVDDDANLVTACADCNLGKSAVPLDDVPLPGAQAQAIREHAEQVRDYLDAARELRAAKDELVQEVVNHWCESFGLEGMSRPLSRQCATYIERLGIEDVLYAVDVTAGAHGVDSMYDRERYFSAVIRNLSKRQGGEG